jgi:hypothetical protein
MGDGMEQKEELFKKFFGTRIAGRYGPGACRYQCTIFFRQFPWGRIVRYGKTDLSPITAMK